MADCPQERLAVVSPRSYGVLTIDPEFPPDPPLSPDAGVCPPDELHWASDVDGDLGTGHQLAVPLRPGEHHITVTAPDGTGGRCTATARITVR